MSASASQIEREVEATRASVEDTVEALKEKMSVGQMVDEASRYFREHGGGQFVSNLGTQVRDNPLPLLLVGVGLAWLMSGRGTPHVSSRGSSGGQYFGFRGDHRFPPYDRDYQSLDADEYRRTFGEGPVYAGASHPDYSRHSTGPYERWGEAEDRGGGGRLRGAAAGAASTLGSAASSIGSAASSLASGVASAASSVTSGLGAVASGVSSAAGSVAGGARSGADYAWQGGAGAYRGASHMGSSTYYGASRMSRGARRSFSDLLETEPLVLGAVGLAIGAAVGALLPRTETEDRYLGETRDRLREDAEQYAREQFERGKAVAQEAYRTAKSEAEAQGLTSSGQSGSAGAATEAQQDRSPSI